MKKVLVFGTFDILHLGHAHFLKKAKKYGDHLTVVVARDATVRKIKGQKAIFCENSRLNNLKKLNIANKVRLGNLGDKYKVITDEKPDVIALGYDQKIFVDNIQKIVKENTQIARVKAYKPQIYKSSKLRAVLDKKKFTLFRSMLDN